MRGGCFIGSNFATLGPTDTSAPRGPIPMLRLQKNKSKEDAADEEESSGCWAVQRKRTQRKRTQMGLRTDKPWLHVPTRCRYSQECIAPAYQMAAFQTTKP